jgi:DNA invertase Pin-like site-specific DNA recombinase
LFDPEIRCRYAPAVSKTNSKPSPAAILVRVSKTSQSVERQTTELRAEAARRGWKVVEVVEESGIGGAADEDRRTGIARIMELAEAGEIKCLMVHEVTRIGRRPAIIHPLVERLHAHGVSLYWHAQRVETLLPDGRRNPAAGMMLAILAEMAFAERETLIERIRSGLDAARRRGARLGRPPGTSLTADDLLAKHADVAALLRRGKSVRDTAGRTGKSPSTVKRVKAVMRAAAA